QADRTMRKATSRTSPPRLAPTSRSPSPSAQGCRPPPCTRLSHFAIRPPCSSGLLPCLPPRLFRPPIHLALFGITGVSCPGLLALLESVHLGAILARHYKYLDRDLFFQVGL